MQKDLVRDLRSGNVLHGVCSKQRGVLAEPKHPSRGREDSSAGKELDKASGTFLDFLMAISVQGSGLAGDPEARRR